MDFLNAIVSALLVFLVCLWSNVVELKLLFGLFRLLRSITTASRLSIYNTSKVQGTSHDFIPHARKILRSPSPHQDDTVFLQIMPLSLDIRHDGLSGTQLHSSNFPLGGIWFLGFRHKYLSANTLALGRTIQKRRSHFLPILWLFSTHGLVEGHRWRW